MMPQRRARAGWWGTAIVLLAGGFAGCRSTAAPPSGLVLAFGGSQARQLDPASLTQIAQLDLGAPAAGAVVDGRRQRLDVVAGRALLIFSLRPFQLLRRIPLNIEPTALRLDEARKQAYIAGKDAGGNGTLLAFDLGRERITARLALGVKPAGMAFSSDRRELVIAGQSEPMIETVAIAPWKRKAIIVLKAPPRRIVTLPFGDKAFALCGEQLAVVDLRRGVLLTYLPVGPQASQVTVKPDGGEVYVSNAGGTVSVVDTATNEISGTMPAGLGAGAMAVAGDGSTLYVANATAGTISVLSLSDRTPLAVIRVGEGPAALALGHEGRYLFVADADSSDVAVVRTNRNPDSPNTLVTLLPAPPHPQALLTATLP